jgi:hypothetical protein
MDSWKNKLAQDKDKNKEETRKRKWKEKYSTDMF